MLSQPNGRRNLAAFSAKQGVLKTYSNSDIRGTDVFYLVSGRVNRGTPHAKIIIKGEILMISNEWDVRRTVSI